jgi:hypothetical protein
LHHDSHILTANSDYCETCGQRLPQAGEGYATWERKSKTNRIGIGISIALHLLGVLYYLFSPSPKPVMPTKSKGGQMVYIQPLPEKVTNKPQPRKPETPKASKPPPPRKQVVTKDTPSAVKPKLETYVPPVQASAEVKFRGWNPNFKRRWLTSVTVERGSEPDIETAIVKKMIEIIRKEKTGDFEWDSHRLGKVVTLSARPQDTKELIAFLYKEMFPDSTSRPVRLVIPATAGIRDNMVPAFAAVRAFSRRATSSAK